MTITEDQSAIEILNKIATELKLQKFQVNNTVKLLLDECTIPFIARYRKELTGSLDEVVLKEIRDRHQYLTELQEMKVKYVKSLEEQSANNPQIKSQLAVLKQKFLAAETKQELDDLYLPFKPKRRTKAQIAREKGLEALLEEILAQRTVLKDLFALAQKYVTPADTNVEAQLRVAKAEDALKGASEILAERINENADFRKLVRDLSFQSGHVVSKKTEAVDELLEATEEAKPQQDKKSKKVEALKYQNYFDFEESVHKILAHRVMAIRRGEAEKFLRVSVRVDQERILEDLKRQVIGKEATTEEVADWLKKTIDDAYTRLMAPSIETEIRLHLKNRAEEASIHVFSKNLENLLLLPPIPGKVVMGLDPGIRTGTKIAVVSETGTFLGKDVIFPDFKGEKTIDSPKTKEAKETIAKLIAKHHVKYVAIGNGTASREIDRIVRETFKEKNIQDVKKIVVNEAGASVYSADDVAREEFPDLDATIRSAISIARRLQDPLAELVKIDPRSIGVGQYQHDVNVNKLKTSLEDVVSSCVNRVGVNLNTASYKLLSYVSGIGATLAKNIVSFRDKNGKFKGRMELQQVPGFGVKAFEQAAGFLRVPDSAHPLDRSAVHPERYEIVERAASSLNQPLSEVIGKAHLVHSIPWENYVSDQVGLPTLRDIAEELIRPGRDPREDGARLIYSDDVSEIEDLKPNMVLQGTVTNVTNFGAFVDVGVHQDGLIHISELANKFVDDPSQVVAVGDVLTVRVLAVDTLRRRISLSAKAQQAGFHATNGPASPSSSNGNRHQEARNSKESRPGQKPGARNAEMRKPEKNFTLDDLLNKFGNS